MSTVVKVYFIYSYISELPTVTELDKTGNIYIRGSAPPQKNVKNLNFSGGGCILRIFPNSNMVLILMIYGWDIGNIWYIYDWYLIEVVPMYQLDNVSTCKWLLSLQNILVFGHRKYIWENKSYNSLNYLILKNFALGSLNLIRYITYIKRNWQNLLL